MESFAEKIGGHMESGGPLYVQLQRALIGAIESGKLTHADALPPERDIASELGLSRVTVRRAIGDLVEQGILSRRQGAGTFVAADSARRIQKNFALISSFSEDMAARGWQASSSWLSKSAGSVSPEEALLFGLSPGTAVYRFHRVRYADGAPLAIEHSTILAWALPSADLTHDSLYQALDEAGSRPVRAVQRLRAVLFDETQASLLDSEAGQPGLLIERRGFLADGRPIEITRSVYRGDAYDFVSELSS
jgi:GntR family transcriptional regulator